MSQQSLHQPYHNFLLLSRDKSPSKRKDRPRALKILDTSAPTISHLPSPDRNRSPDDTLSHLKQVMAPPSPSHLSRSQCPSYVPVSPLMRLGLLQNRRHTALRAFANASSFTRLSLSQPSLEFFACLHILYRHCPPVAGFNHVCFFSTRLVQPLLRLL
jgi:hypothetical protein